jgi:hypothetical protein
MHLDLAGVVCLAQVLGAEHELNHFVHLPSTMSQIRRVRSQGKRQEWFDNPNNPGMTALYLERYQNQTFTREELQSGRP